MIKLEYVLVLTSTEQVQSAFLYIFLATGGQNQFQLSKEDKYETS